MYRKCPNCNNKISYFKLFKDKKYYLCPSCNKYLRYSRWIRVYESFLIVCLVIIYILNILDKLDVYRNIQSLLWFIILVIFFIRKMIVPLQIDDNVKDDEYIEDEQKREKSKIRKYIDILFVVIIIGGPILGIIGDLAGYRLLNQIGGIMFIFGLITWVTVAAMVDHFPFRSRNHDENL